MLGRAGSSPSSLGDASNTCGKSYPDIKAILDKWPIAQVSTNIFSADKEGRKGEPNVTCQD